MTVSCVSFFPPVLPYGYIITALRAEAVSSRIVGFIFAFTCSFAQIMQRALAVTISQSLTAGEVNVRGKGREERERERRRGTVYCRQEIVYMCIESERKRGTVREGREEESRRGNAQGTVYTRTRPTHASRVHAHTIYMLQIRYRIIIKC